MRFFHTRVVAFAWPVEPVANSTDSIVDHVPRTWESTNCLHVFQPNQWWGTRLMWEAATGNFLCWYVDFLRPVQVHGNFVDTRDLSLDIVVLPDGTSIWKDEDRYAHKVDVGLIDEEERASVELARDHAVAAIHDRRFPFDGSYLDWRPDGRPRALPDDVLRVG